jgi:hypothetical protein
MPTPSKPVPIVGEPNTTADPKIHDLLAELVSILTANVDRNNLMDAEVTKAKLATDALSTFLKLGVATDLSLRYGRSGADFGFSAAGDLSTLDVVHGFGHVPVFALAIQANGGHYGGGVRCVCDIANFDPDGTHTKLRIGGTCIKQPLAPVVAADVWWVAIG